MSAATPIRDASTYDGLESLITGQGGAKDSRAHSNRTFGYTPRTHGELEALYRSNWLAGQIVDIPAFEMTRAKRTFQIEDPGKLDSIESESKRLMLWEKISEVLKWRSLYGGGALLLGLDGTGELDEPLELERVKPGALRFVHALDSRTLIPNGGMETQLVYDPTSSQFMQPEFYSLAAAKMEWIHHSRIVRFPGLPLPWREMQRTLWWGQSKLERVFDAIADTEQVIGGVAHLVKEASVDVIGIDGLMGLLMTPEGEDTVRRRISLSDMTKSMWNSIVIDSQESYNQKQNALVQGMAGLIEQYLVIAAGASGIPVTRLLGMSPGGMNSTGESDTRNFYDMVDAERENYLEPRLNEFDQIFIRSAIGESPDDIAWEFGSLWQMDDAEVAELENKRAQTAKTYVDMGAIDEVVVAKELKENRTYTAVDDKYIQELEAEIEEFKANPPPASTIPGAPGNPPIARDPAGNPIPQNDPDDDADE
jgi:phage-related protein (TIGR01555 family)